MFVVYYKWYQLLAQLNMNGKNTELFELFEKEEEMFGKMCKSIGKVCLSFSSI